MNCEIGRKVEMFKESGNSFLLPKRSWLPVLLLSKSRFKTYSHNHVVLTSRTLVTFQGSSVLSLIAVATCRCIGQSMGKSQKTISTNTL